MSRPKLPPYQRKKSSTVTLNGRTSHPQLIITSPMATQIIPERYAADLPKGMVALDNQVAGHTFQTGTDSIGLLKDQHDGSIMKPITKPLCGTRERKFYEILENTNDQCLVMLKELVPEYRGTVSLHMGGRDIDFVKLTDLTHSMLEPCIMDVKIGKRTWDPLASEEKRIAEEQKYFACKQNLGLCIPGFQVHCISSGKCKRYDKDYGKKLNETTIKDALRKFLNGDAGLCRPLLMQFLSGLWEIQKWARNQKILKLYSSSLLLVYDARRLRSSLDVSKKSWNKLNASNGSLTPTTPNGEMNGDSSNGSGRSSPFGFPSERKISDQPPVQCYRKIQRSHSAQNNYDEDLKSIRENYVYMLDNLISNNHNKQWAFVKMIDFAHAFPSEDDAIDANYLFGIENLVKLFEEFLKECE